MINKISELHSQKLLSVDERIKALIKFKNTIIENEENIYEAFKKDLNKSKKETYISEISEVISEIEYHIKKLKKWSKPKKVKDTFQVMKTKSYIISKPKGKVLIISPFNYPFNLCFMPLVGSISGGNNSLIKPSPKTPNVNKVISKIIDEAFDKTHVSYIDESNLKSNDDIYNYKPDMIFFTGSTTVGKIIEKNCVEKGIEFVTELGGKCPCIVNDYKENDIFKRIVWAKYMNAGQTCVSINHIIYNSSLTNFINNLINEIKVQYPEPILNKNIPKIVSKDDFNRLIKIIKKYNDKIIFGGKYDENSLIIEPTIIKVSPKEVIDTEEIFGPILFVIESESIKDMIEISNNIDNSPLASYIYSNDKNIINLFIQRINSGSYAVNDSMSQILNHHLPFGGVKNSGFGRYHGKWSFDTFTYQKPILTNFSKKANQIKYINNDINLEKTKKLISFAKKIKG